MAMGAESSDPSSLRASAREQALPFETMEYQRRREAADQRRADAQRFLTTPIPGAEAPLAALGASALRRTRTARASAPSNWRRRKPESRAQAGWRTELMDDRSEEPTPRLV